jgi:hypothetical protein
VAVRPERIRIGPNVGDAENIFPVTVVESTFLGARNQILVKAGTQTFRVEVEAGPTAGDSLVHIPTDACIVFPTPAGAGQVAVMPPSTTSPAPVM